MNRKMPQSVFALAGVMAAGLLAFTQSSAPSRAATGKPGTSPTPAPAAALTPGSASQTPKPASPPTTPGYGSNLYSIPKSTPVGMPIYPTVVGGTTATTPARPVTASDCGNGGWRNYDALQFKSQKGCEAWVKHHPAVGSAAPTTPRRARRSRYPTPPSSTTPSHP